MDDESENPSAFSTALEANGCDIGVFDAPISIYLFLEYDANLKVEAVYLWILLLIQGYPIFMEDTLASSNECVDL